MATHVNVDNFVAAETARMFSDIQRSAGGVNVLRHHREPASIDAQTVIRLNRDTLYSFAVVDVSEAATLTLPEAGDRYVSAMILDERHYVRAVLHDAGEHDLRALAPKSTHVLVALRILVDPDDENDVAEVGRVQDAVGLVAASVNPYPEPDNDSASLDATRAALLQLAAGMADFDRTFGRRRDVDPVHHLIGTAAGWGGLPTTEASYVGVAPGLPVGTYELTMKDVPVDAFWSVSVYNAEGYFEANDDGRYSVNSVTGMADEDGSITVRFTPPGEVAGPNDIPLPEGWNFLVRLYRPRDEFRDGTWSVPDLVVVHADASTPQASDDAADGAADDAADAAPDTGGQPTEALETFEPEGDTPDEGDAPDEGEPRTADPA